MTTRTSPVHMLALLAAAFFWGTTFVAQSLGAGAVGTFTFLMLRSYLGAFFVFLMLLLRRLLSRKKLPAEDAASALSAPERPASSHPLLIAGVCCGVCLFLASALQQYGIELYVADSDLIGTAKSSFITAMYVVIVPLLSFFLGKRPSRKSWLAVALCVAGLYLLCLSGTLSFSRGDFFVLLCALGFSVQIMTVDYFSIRVDGLKLSALEFLVTGIISTVCVLLFDQPTLAGVRTALPAILYTAVFSNAIAYTCQIFGQRGVRPTVASLGMCLESVFGVLSGWVVLHEALTSRQIIGCVLMFAALLVSSLPSPKR